MSNHGKKTTRPRNQHVRRGKHERSTHRPSVSVGSPEEGAEGETASLTRSTLIDSRSQNRTAERLFARMGSTAKVDENAPVRLEDIIPLAFPAGGITLAGLRKEVARGNLVVERIAGKLFTTLTEIERMRERCREKKVSGLPGKDAVRRSELSDDERVSLAQESLLSLLNTPLRKLPKKR